MIETTELINSLRTCAKGECSSECSYWREYRCHYLINSEAASRLQEQESEIAEQGQRIEELKLENELLKVLFGINSPSGRYLDDRDKIIREQTTEIMQLKDAIAKTAKVVKSCMWKSVETPPEKDGTYLVCTDDMYADIISLEFRSDKKWHWGQMVHTMNFGVSDFWAPFKKVKYWMEMIELPNEGNTV